MSSSPNYVLEHRSEGHRKAVSSVKFSPNGRLLSSASADKTVKLWNTRGGTFTMTLEGHTKGISDASWSSDSRFLTTASDDHTLKLWDVETASTASIPCIYILLTAVLGCACRVEQCLR